MNNYFIKDNRIRFFNLALVMVLLSLLVAFLSKIQYQLVLIVSHQEVFLMAMTQIIIVSTWVYMGINEAFRFIRQILFPIPSFQAGYKFTTKEHQPVRIELLFYLNQQRHMVMRC